MFPPLTELRCAFTAEYHIRFDEAGQNDNVFTRVANDMTRMLALDSIIGNDREWEAAA